MRAGPLELRGVRDDDLPVLVDVALAGIHDPSRMSFAFPWTDVPNHKLPLNFVQDHWRSRADFAHQDTTGGPSAEHSLGGAPASPGVAR